MKKLSLLTLISVFSMVAIADPVKLTVLDTDKDGKISKQEAADDPTLSSMFAELDKNEDGYLTKDELDQ
ncbi:hypothetical protein OE749_04855 [Aestuariibacter sp. AA17]|uniref:EF-hand domain-containing protein n=1 Tax=Fluctibacter corallii TaxID=2984329 RepID=A0ABT3A6V4_9ALTE|nr:EF-hand domain-containing protein [Aestuariibacter sp. AA17]MCV2884017.1 hypothetical protein [Aestuariibacter sp. AA17]